MSEATLDLQRHPPMVVVVVLAAVFVGVALAVLHNNHPVERRGEAMTIAVRSCVETPNPSVIAHNPANGRIAVCSPMGDKWAVQIREADNTTEVTSFPNKSKTVEQLVRYLLNVGFVVGGSE